MAYLNSRARKKPACVIYGGISLLRAMADTGIECHVAGDSPGDLTRYSRASASYNQIPPLSSDSEQVIAGLVGIANRFREKPVLYYGNDRTMRLLSTHRDALSGYFRFLMPEKEVLTACSEKDKFSDLARELRLMYPKSLVVAEALDESALKQMRPPYVIKPDITSDLDKIAAIARKRTQKALLASSFEEALEIAERLLEDGVAFLVQELVAGDESNIFSYHAFNDADFLPLGEFAGRKVRTYPAFGGRSTCLRLVHDEEVLNIGRQIAFSIGIAGPVKLDFKRDSVSGKLFLIEANPRFTLWNHLGAACGVNLALIAYQYLTGREVKEASDYRTDRHWVTFVDDLRSHIASHSGRLSSAVSYPFFRNKPVFHRFDWSDPLPAVIGLKRELVNRT